MFEKLSTIFNGLFMKSKSMVMYMLEDFCVSIAYLVIAMHYLHLAIG